MVGFWAPTVATAITYIDDFNDGDISEYTGETGSYDVVSSASIPIIEGSHMLSRGANTGYESIYSTSGLSYYPTQDEPFGIDVYSGATDGGSTTQFGFKYGVQDSNNWYEMRYEFDDDDLILTISDGGSESIIVEDLSATNGYYTSPETLFFRVNWTSGGEHTCELYDQEGGTLLGGIGPVTDTTHGNGGVGCRTYKASSGTDLFADAARRVA